MAAYDKKCKCCVGRRRTSELTNNLQGMGDSRAGYSQAGCCIWLFCCTGGSSYTAILEAFAAGAAAGLVCGVAATFAMCTYRAGSQAPAGLLRPGRSRRKTGSAWAHWGSNGSDRPASEADSTPTLDLAVFNGDGEEEEQNGNAGEESEE